MPGESSAREFVELEIHPARRTWEDLRFAPISSRRLSAIVLLEAYGWLRLGVRSEAFPQFPLGLLMDSSWHAIWQANEFAASDNVLKEYVNHETRQLIKSRGFGSTFRELYKAEFDELPDAATIFHLWWGEVRSFSRFRSSVRFIDLINFSDKDQWESAMDFLRDETFQPDPDKVPEVSLVEGYLRFLQHLDRMANLSEVGEIPFKKWPARAIMRIEVADIHRWQFDFRNAIVKARLAATAKAVEDILRAQAGKDGSKLEAGGLVNAVENLIQRYAKETGPLPISVPAD